MARQSTPQETFAFAVMVAGLGSMLFQIDPLDNTLRGVQLFFLGCAPGAVGGALVRHRFNEQLASTGVPSVNRSAVVLVVVLGLSFGSAAIASHWNIHGGQGPSQEVSLPIYDKGTGGKRGDSHYMHVLWENRRERLIVREALYQSVTLGQVVTVEVAPGALGYPHVTAFGGAQPPPNKALQRTGE